MADLLGATSAVVEASSNTVEEVAGKELTIKQLETEARFSGVDDDDWRLSDAPAALFQVDRYFADEVKQVVEDFHRRCQEITAKARLLKHGALEAVPESLVRDSSSPHCRTESNETAVSSEPSDVLSSTQSAAKSSITSVSRTSSLVRSQSITTDKQLASGGTGNLVSGGVTIEEPVTKSSRGAMLRKLFKGKASIRSATSDILSTSTSIATVECASCFDDTPSREAVSLACTHYYCSECFITMIQTSMQNESFWPPKCCLQEIPRPKIIKQLPDEILKEFSVKEREYTTPTKDRWYCTQPECGKWFEGRKVGGLTKCPHCNGEMCVFCRGEKHKVGEHCAQDKGQRLLEEEAILEGWRKCYNCQAMVELMTGCRHITCTCKAEFCYTCGARWKTCSCTEDDQAERRRELATRRAQKLKEEAELEEVLAQVAVAERREREQRILDEKRQLQTMEVARVESILTRFETLRSELATLLSIQLACLREAQGNDEHAVRVQIDALMAEQVGLEECVEKEVAQYAETMKIRSGNHAVARNLTIARHAEQKRQSDYHLGRLKTAKQLTEAEASRHAGSLMLAQQKELNELWDQQRRESDRLESRLAALRVKPQWVQERDRLWSETMSAEKTLLEISRRIEKDTKWVELARGERNALLKAMERNAISTGQDDVAATIADLDRQKATIEEEEREREEKQSKIHSEIFELSSVPEPRQEVVARTVAALAQSLYDPNEIVSARLAGNRAESSRQGAEREAAERVRRLNNDYGGDTNVGSIDIWHSKSRGQRLGMKLQVVE